MVSAVIFDMDGVLVDNSQVHDETWRIVCEKYGKKESINQIKNIFGGTNEIFVERLLGITDKQLARQIAKEKEALYREVFSKTIKAPDGLIPLLFSLRKRKIRLAVGSSGPKENLDFVLDSLEIRGFFDVLVDESKVNKGKPDPEIYLKVAQELKISPTECVVFEDSIFGLEAAKAAGMKVIAITTSFSRDKLQLADIIIDSFTEIDVQSILKLNHDE